jgi:alpha-tubulin suppressor-like RCC1 family protein
MPLTYPYQQYQGVWTLSQASDAVAQSKWPPSSAPHLYAWGQNPFGQLGLNNRTYYSSPKQIGSLTNWSVLQNGLGSSGLAIKADGTLWSWGQNNSGQLGLGNTTYYSSPKQVGALTNWSSVSQGLSSTLAIKTDGTLWAWGKNNNGQLGLNNTTNYSSPKQVGSLTNWAKVVGGGFSLAIKTNGTLWTWGLNPHGQLGLNNTTNYSSPKQVGTLTNWLSIASGYYHTTAIKTDGTFWSWGYNAYGQLGLGNITDYSSPKQVGSLTNWSSITNHPLSSTLTIKTDGTLWSWGYGNDGCLGLNNTTSYSSPKQVGSLTNWLKLSAAGYSVAVIKTDGTAWVWGQNFGGQLGLGNTTYYSSPKQLGSLTTWSSISVNNGWMIGIAKT